jgi:hypothetical protein
VAHGEEGDFETGDAIETPADVGNGLEEGGFLWADGLELLLIGEEEGFVLSGVFGAEKNGAAGETGLYSVERDSGFTGGSGGPG